MNPYVTVLPSDYNLPDMIVFLNYELYHEFPASSRVLDCSTPVRGLRTTLREEI